MADPLDTSGLTDAQKEKLLSLCGIQGPGPLLFAILEQLMINGSGGGGGGGGNVVVTGFTRTKRTLVKTTISSSTTFTGGQYAAIFIPSSDFVGSIGGTPIDPATKPTLSYTPDENGLVPDVPVVVTSGTVDVQTLT